MDEFREIVSGVDNQANDPYVVIAGIIVVIIVALCILYLFIGYLYPGIDNRRSSYISKNGKSKLGSNNYMKGFKSQQFGTSPMIDKRENIPDFQSNLPNLSPNHKDSQYNTKNQSDSPLKNQNDNGGQEDGNNNGDFPKKEDLTGKEQSTSPSNVADDETKHVLLTPMYKYLETATNGQFRKLLPSDGKCFFRTWEENGVRKFEFHKNVDRALANINAIFDDVCEIEGKQNGATQIINVEPGILSSQLKVEKMAKIKLI